MTTLYSITVHLMNSNPVVITGYESLAVAREAAKYAAKNGICYDENGQHVVYPPLQIEKLVVGVQESQPE